MTRRPRLTSTLLLYVSGAALTVGGWTSPRHMCESPEAALSLLARFGIWLSLIFGLSSKRYSLRAVAEPDYTLSRHQLRAAAHRRKRHVSGRKRPAHDLEMLMGFVPGCRLGLTLNQYRERFTRLSVLGRVRVYAGFFRRLKWLRLHRVCCAVIQNKLALCQAPLRPD